ncbi:MAG: IS1380 family transposase [Nitrospirales bacterium]|nr:IS1380 family transposase [Nitrospirales bacterium]
MAETQTTYRIAQVDTTSDTLTSRGGLALFVRYLSQIQIAPLLEEAFGSLRKNRKGLPLWALFQQLFCFLLDGTSRHLRYFDHLKADPGYAATLETSCAQLASSHTMKRLFKAFAWTAGGSFRTILNQLCVWRLKLACPRVIEATIDTMVLDNDEAPKRHGVQPTYKKVKGFQPLQMIWAGKIVDAVFRGGSKHSNAGHTVVNMLRRMVPLMRQACGSHVVIIIRFDSGFFDEAILRTCDELQVGVIMTGKMYPTIKAYVGAQDPARWAAYDNGHQEWEYLEFGWRCERWTRHYRTLYTRAVTEPNGQRLLDFARPDNVILTNLGVNAAVLAHASVDDCAHWTQPATLIASHHRRGADELPHRGLKDFGFEELPFKRFPANAAFYYGMLIAFFLSETFKEDVLVEVLPITSYATTVRRMVIDIAAKVVRTGGQVILKVTHSVMTTLRFAQLWARCQSPPPISPA